MGVADCRSASGKAQRTHSLTPVAKSCSPFGPMAGGDFSLSNPLRSEPATSTAYRRFVPPLCTVLKPRSTGVLHFRRFKGRFSYLSPFTYFPLASLESGVSGGSGGNPSIHEHSALGEVEAKRSKWSAAGGGLDAEPPLSASPAAKKERCAACQIPFASPVPRRSPASRH